MIAEPIVDRKLEETILLKSTGHEKVLVSICLAAKGEGTQLKPFVVFHGAKREVVALNDEYKNEYKNECIVATSNAWMNEDLTHKLIQQLLGMGYF